MLRPRQGDPSLEDRRPPPRSGSDPPAIGPTRTRSQEPREAASPATDDPGVEAEVAELLLLFGILLGAVALADVLLHP